MPLPLSQANMFQHLRGSLSRPTELSAWGPNQTPAFRSWKGRQDCWLTDFIMDCPDTTELATVYSKMARSAGQGRER
jgi:hypothetical protein